MHFFYRKTPSSCSQLNISSSWYFKHVVFRYIHKRFNAADWNLSKSREITISSNSRLNNKWFLLRWFPGYRGNNKYKKNPDQFGLLSSELFFVAIYHCAQVQIKFLSVYRDVPSRLPGYNSGSGHGAGACTLFFSFFFILKVGVRNTFCKSTNT